MTDQLESQGGDRRIDLTADPMVLGSAVLVALGLLLLIVGVAGSWHWRAAIWLAVLASLGAFALVAVSARQRSDEFPAQDYGAADLDQPSGALPAHRSARRPKVAVEAAAAADTAAAVTPGAAATTAAAGVKPGLRAGADEAPPRPRFAGFGKPKPAEATPEVKPPPPQPTNVQVMHVQGSNVRVAPTPQPMPISRPAAAAVKPPSTPPSTPPTIQVGVPRTPGFPTYQPVDPQAPVIQVRNRYHKPDCRYVSVADEAVPTTVGAARASNAMPCGVCRP